MKIYRTQEQVEADIVDNVLTVDGAVIFDCSISIQASIIVNLGSITAQDINAWDINARDINAQDINAGDINAQDINAGDINAQDINARDINAQDINAGDINAGDIIAKNVRYYAFCNVYDSIKCSKIEAKRDSNYSKPVCLDGKLTII